MKNLKLLSKILLSLPILLIFTNKSIALTYDFEMINDTKINYSTADDFVKVNTEFTRKVNNRAYFFSTTGEKIFHIPDSASAKDYEVELERQYKLDTLSVTGSNGNKISYTVEQLDLGQGMYIKVPNYKQTTYSSPYTVNLNYKTHIYVKYTPEWVAIQIPALHEETEFIQEDESSDTKTRIEYNLDIVVDDEIPPLTKVLPSEYTTSKKSDTTTYSFKGQDRVGAPVYMEFGTARVFRFETQLKTPKTDNIVPEKYSDAIEALSTNIYQIPLPREFGETNQRVMIEKIQPQPTKITMDSEGNITGTFEVPANRETTVYISGYIWLEQEVYEKRKSIPNLLYTEYIDLVSKDSNLSKYLLPTKYWESTDPFITTKALELMDGKETLTEVIRGDYSYINDVLEYDYSKAESSNERIGAKAALQGGGSVCMEYSDSMIALLRAQGIPTRAAVGYAGLDGTKGDTPNVPHQWVQVWIPEYGWLSIDPTYESVNMQIGVNIDSILWESFFDDDETNLGVYTADDIDLNTFTKDNYSIYIYAVDPDTVPSQDTLLSYNDIVQKDTQESIQDTLNILVKTTTIGKAFIIVLPIAVILILLILLLSLINILIRRTRTQKVSSNQQP